MLDVVVAMLCCCYSSSVLSSCFCYDVVDVFVYFSETFHTYSVFSMYNVQYIEQ